MIVFYSFKKICIYGEGIIPERLEKGIDLLGCGSTAGRLKLARDNVRSLAMGSNVQLDDRVGSARARVCRHMEDVDVVTAVVAVVHIDTAIGGGGHRRAKLVGVSVHHGDMCGNKCEGLIWCCRGHGHALASPRAIRREGKQCLAVVARLLLGLGGGGAIYE